MGFFPALQSILQVVQTYRSASLSLESSTSESQLLFLIKPVHNPLKQRFPDFNRLNIVEIECSWCEEKYKDSGACIESVDHQLPRWNSDGTMLAFLEISRSQKT